MYINWWQDRNNDGYEEDEEKEDHRHTYYDD